MNMTQHKVNVFSTHGLQTNRYVFDGLTKTYGKPKAVSNNGQFFLFGKKKKLLLYVMMLTSTKMVLIKEIDVEENMRDYLMGDDV